MLKVAQDLGIEVPEVKVPEPPKNEKAAEVELPEPPKDEKDDEKKDEKEDEENEDEKKKDEDGPTLDLDCAALLEAAR